MFRHWLRIHNKWCNISADVAHRSKPHYRHHKTWCVINSANFRRVRVWFGAFSAGAAPMRHKSCKNSSARLLRDAYINYRCVCRLARNPHLIACRGSTSHFTYTHTAAQRKRALRQKFPPVALPWRAPRQFALYINRAEPALKRLNK